MNVWAPRILIVTAEDDGVEVWTRWSQSAHPGSVELGHLVVRGQMSDIAEDYRQTVLKQQENTRALSAQKGHDVRCIMELSSIHSFISYIVLSQQSADVNL